MNNYTPTTEEVREDYALGRNEVVGAGWYDQHRAEFDRWLAAHDAEVLAAAGVTQPEPEYEYAMEDDLGMSFAKDRRDAERHASFQSKEYHPRVVRHVKAGDWEPVPNQTGETP